MHQISKKNVHFLEMRVKGPEMAILDQSYFNEIGFPKEITLSTKWSFYRIIKSQDII